MFGPSPVLAVEHFTDLDDFRPHEILGGGTSFPLHPKEFSVSRATLSLPAGLLVLQRSFARRLEADMGARGTGLIVPVEGPVNADINGQVLDSSSIALLRKNVPARVLEPHPHTYLMLRFNSEMHDRGWAEFDSGIRFVSSEARLLEQLRAVVLEVFRIASDCTDPKEFAKLNEAAQETLLAAFDAVLIEEELKREQPRSIEKHRRMVARLDDLIQTIPAAPLYSEQLAQSLGSSARSLQTAVKAVRGMSLHHYLRLKRLWWVRDELLTGKPYLTVKAAAVANGFWHMGEFSQLYKNTFGETASETLARVRKFYTRS